MDGQGRHTFTEQIETTGGELVERVKALAKDADARRVVIKDQDGKELVTLPLTWGVAGGAFAVMAAPALAAVAAIGGVLAKVQLEVERTGDPGAGAGGAAPAGEQAGEPFTIVGSPEPGLEDDVDGTGWQDERRPG